MKILIVRSDRLGDLLMSLPAVRQIRRGLPGVKTCLLIRKEWKPILEQHPDVDEILAWDIPESPGWWVSVSWARRLRTLQFDAAVIFNPSRAFHLASFLAGIPVRIGYRRKWGFLLSSTLQDTKAQRRLHEAEYNLELVRLLGISTGEPHLEIPVDDRKVREAENLLQQKGLPPQARPVALHPFSSNRSKSWPWESFEQLARRLSQAGLPVLTLGQDQDRLPQIAGVVHLVNQIPLGLLPAALKRCAVLVSNDSGPVHIAAAVGTPTVVVAPLAHARMLERWRPLGKGHRLLLQPSVEQVEKEVMDILRERCAC